MSDVHANLAAALARIPYVGFLGVRPDMTDGELTLILPYKEHLIGNPLLPALHGGAVGALMEFTALGQLAIAAKTDKFPKTIDIYVDYLRTGRPADTYARARMVKIGRRIANVDVEAWQDERTQPIASMRGHFLVAEEAPS